MNMRPLIVASDFSPASENALRYGAALAIKLRCPLLLLNVYSFPEMAGPESSIAMMPYEVFIERSQEGLKKMETDIRESFPDINMQTKSLLGDLVDQLREQADLLDPLFVIIGGRGNHGNGILFGSSAQTILKNFQHPLLSVPENYDATPPTVALLATDLSPIADNTKKHLSDIVKTLNLELHLVHVTSKKNDESHEELMADLKGLAIDFKTVISNDLSEGVEEYVQQLDAELVITLPHSHPWLESLFIRKHTKELMTELHLPLLCIPDTD